MYTGVTNINFKIASINWEMSYMNNLFLKINKFQTVVKHVAYSYAIAINLLSVDIAHPQTNCCKFRIVANTSSFRFYDIYIDYQDLLHTCTWWQIQGFCTCYTSYQPQKGEYDFCRADMDLYHIPCKTPLFFPFRIQLYVT